MEKENKVHHNITILPSHLDKVKKESKKLFGRTNVSGFIGHLIEKLK